MSPSSGRKQNRLWRPLPVLAMALLPVFARGLDHSNDTYFLRDDVNTGGTLQDIPSLNLRLNGSVQSMETTVVGDGATYEVAAGPQNNFYIPTTIKDLNLIPRDDTSLLMTWTAPGAGFNSIEKVNSYEIRYSLSPIDDENFLSASLRSGDVVIPRSPGSSHSSVPLEGLTYDTAYYVGIVSFDNNAPRGMSLVGTGGPVRTKPKEPSFIGFLSHDDEEKTITADFRPENDQSGHNLKFEGRITTSALSPDSPTETKEIFSVTDNEPQSLTFGTSVVLNRNSNYYVFIRAFGDNGDGPSTKWVRCSDPVKLKNGIPNLDAASNVTASSFQVNWTRSLSLGKYQAVVDLTRAFDSALRLPDPSSNVSKQSFTVSKGNTVYYFKVAAWDKHGTYLGETDEAQVVTHVLKPGGIGANSLSSSGAIVQWTDDENNGNLAHSFKVEVASNSFATGPSMVERTVSFSASHSMEADFRDSLIPNTPYYVKLTGKNVEDVYSTGSDVYTSNVPVFYTYPRTPVLTIAPAADPTSQIAFSLDSKGNNLYQTRYVARLYASSDCSGEAVGSPKVIGPGASSVEPFVFENSVGNRYIFANRVYSVCASAEWAGSPSDRTHDTYSAAVSTSTKPLPPQEVAVAEASESLTVSWLDGSAISINTLATDYELEWRLQGSPVLISSKRVNGSITPLNLVAEPLLPNTTYQLTLKTLSSSGWPNESWAETHVTWAKQPVISGFTLHTDSATVAWTENGNPAGKTLYRIEVDADKTFASPDVIKEPYLSPVSLSGLIPNTTYYAQMKALNNAVPPVSTEWVKVWDSSATSPAVPIVTPSDFKIYTDSGTVSWSPNGNSVGTRYRVWLATESTFGTEPRVWNLTQTGAGNVPMSQELRPLLSNQVYFVRVDVLGHNGSILSSTVLNKATSAGPVPEVTLFPSGGMTRELTLQWDNTKYSSETRYDVELSTQSNFEDTGKRQYTTLPNANNQVFSGLMSNQRFYGRVRVASGAGEFLTVADAFTRPEIPLGVVPRRSGLPHPTREVAFDWNHGNNNPMTRYEVVLKLGEVVLSSLNTGPGDQTWMFDEKNGVVVANQKYAVLVKARSLEEGFDSGWVSTDVYTAPLATISATVSEVSTGSFRLSWDRPSVSVDDKNIANSEGTQYQLEWYWMEGIDRKNGLVGMSGVGPHYEYVFGEGSPLLPNTTYFISIRSLRVVGNPSDSALYSTTGVTDPKPAILKFENMTVHQTSMTVVWNSNGNPPGTQYELGVADSYYVTNTPRITTPSNLKPSTAYLVRLAVIGHNKKRVEPDRSFTQITLPAAPVVVGVDKPDPDARGQKLTLLWSDGENGDRVRYSVRIDGETGIDPGSARALPFEGLAANKETLFRIKATNGFTSDFIEVSTRVWTRAEPPLAPTIETPLSEGTLGIGFPGTTNPEGTPYAIQLTTGPDAEEPFDVLNQNFARLLSPGVATFSSPTPVWLTREEWVSAGRLLLRELPALPGYRIVLYTKNQSNDSVEGPGPGLNIEQSAGVPSLTLATVWGEETHLSSEEKEVYVGNSALPFRAVGSSHFNVQWGAERQIINEDNISDSFGWNGTLDSDVLPCVELNTRPFAIRDAPVSGFCVQEGLFFLNIAGTALVGGRLDMDHILSTTSFRVFVDTTPPVPTDLQLSFSLDPFVPLPENTLFGNSSPHLVWKSEDALGASISRSPVVGWSYSVSTDSAVTPIRSTQPTGHFIPFVENPSVSEDLRGVTLSSATVYYKVRAYDRAGNWTPDDQVPEFRYAYTPDRVLPELSAVEMDGKLFPTLDKTIRFAAVTPRAEFLHMTFSEPMLIPRNSFQLILVRGADGRLVNRPIALSPIVSSLATFADGKQKLPFSSDAQLEPGCLYHFFVSSSPAPTDRANNPLTGKIDVLFYTAMDPATPAVFTGEGGDVSVSVSAYALGTEPAGVAINDRPDKVSLAGSPALPGLLDEANTALARQKGGGRKIFVAKELTAFKTSGEPALRFPGNLQMAFSYAEFLGAEGSLAGTAIKTKDLVLCELDERTGVWNKMPNSRVDEGSKKVFAPFRHNGTYALEGELNFDLASAHPYPVPYRSAKDAHGIRFTGLSSFGTIKVFTLDGRLVKSFSFNGESSVAWDPVATDSGELAGSDVYLYVIENDQQRVVGKLMVIR